MSARNHAAKWPIRNAFAEAHAHVLARACVGAENWPIFPPASRTRRPDMPNTERPFLILTAICDASARPAAVTLGHGDAMERALRASNGLQTDGMDLIELPIAPAAFAALRKHLQIQDGRVTVYDLFPLS